MMDILIRDAMNKREQLLKDMQTLEKDIEETNLTEAIENNYEILKEVLQQHQQYIKDKKLRKLKRDANDYKSGRVFSYACKYDNVRLDKQVDIHQTCIDDSTSIASTSDSEVSSISSKRSQDSSNLNAQKSIVATDKSPFLLELQRYRKGQKPSWLGPQAQGREPGEAKGKAGSGEKEREGVTTKAASRNLVK
ncbi:hypothetical protein NDU88_004015 [Pleurodeles waltl]|uniref:Uncharacterized protein n=1 Tax=Pleurodeles waltl TaxID=8319 RepID=A0AAV7VFV6_PLEWA|nr:hypothetical protein NDU88_004015 [Pleurodeles waltl]